MALSSPKRGSVRSIYEFGGAALLCAAMIVSGCGGSTTMQRCPGTDPGSHDQCMVSNDPGVAVANAAIAGGVWAVAGGCNINGCLPPLHCNGESGLCERIPCDEGRQCPSGYECDLESHSCR